MPPLRRLTFENKLLLVFVAGLLVLLGTIFYSMQLARLAAEVDAQRDLTSQRLRTLNLTLSALQDAETGQRGYLITGEPDYLEPFELALGQMERLFGELRRLYRDAPADLERVGRMRRLKDAKLAELRRTIALRRQDGSAAMEAVRQGEGKAYMDSFRAEMRELLEEERALHAALSRLAQQRRVQSQSAYVAVFSGTLLAGLGAWLLLVRELQERRRLPAAALEVELTEGLLLRPDTAESIARLKSMGVRIAVDDFGTGYSSLAYLKRFAVDHVKIDRSFVDGLPGDRTDAAIVRAIASMAQHLGLSLVAEGVETQAQADFLRGLQCDYFQGYLYGRPMAADEFARRALPGSAAA